jgi:hypothetical protein
MSAGFQTSRLAANIVNTVLSVGMHGRHTGLFHPCVAVLTNIIEYYRVMQCDLDDQVCMHV